MAVGAVWIELLGAAASMVVLVAYQLWLRWRIRRDPSRSVQSVNRLVRSAWVEAMMASTLMGSTAVILIIGALSASPELPRLAVAWQSLHSSGGAWPQGAVVKVLAVLAALFLSFFFFAMAVRSFNHVGYMISVPPGSPLTELSAAQVTAHLERATFYHYLGLRSFLFCVPLVFALYRLDRPPPAMPHASAERMTRA